MIFFFFFPETLLKSWTFNSLAGNQDVYWKKTSVNFADLFPNVFFECLINLYCVVNIGISISKEKSIGTRSVKYLYCIAISVLHR